MHKLIDHFARIRPTWLLLDSDWAQTKQSAPFLPSCSDIVPIGRVKWIEGSRSTGKDNHAWFRFDARHKGVTAIHRGNQGEEISSPRRTVVCEQCRRSYQPQRSIARFCSEACRQRAHYRKLSVRLSVRTEPTSNTEEFRYVRHDDVPNSRPKAGSRCRRWTARTTAITRC